MPVYVQHEVLGKVADVFNAEALWQAPGLALFARRPLLRDLLERWPREQRGRTATRCFSHVTVALPQDEVDDDRHLTRGARVRDLASALAALHQKDFGDLLGHDDVRYHVVGADSLEAGQVAVRFGHAVYLPAPGEAVLYQVATSHDSAIWQTACVIYQNQRLALVGGTGSGNGNGRGNGSEADDNADGEPAILLINDAIDAPLEVQVRPKQAFDCSFDAVGGYHVIRAKPGQGSARRLLLKVTRMGAPARAAAALDARAVPASPATPAAPAASAAAMAAARPRPAAVWKARADATALPLSVPLTTPLSTAPAPACIAISGAAPAAAMPGLGGVGGSTGIGGNAGSAGSTGIGGNAGSAGISGISGISDFSGSGAIDATDATYAPLASARVSLAALALPRLSRYRDTGAAALDIGLDERLAVAAAGANAVIRFAVDSDDVLVAITAAGHQRVNVPASFAPIDGASVHLAAVAAAMAERYRALLILPEQARSTGLPVAAGARFVFGRGAPMLAALRVLDAARFIRHAVGRQDDAASGASADRIGLSRQAFSFEATSGGWQIGRLAATQALYHLDESLAFVAAISGDAPYLLPSGHHLVAGHYVLRFDAGVDAGGDADVDAYRDNHVDADVDAGVDASAGALVDARAGAHAAAVPAWA